MQDVKQCKSVEDMIKFAQNLGHKDPSFARVETKANEVVDPTTNANWYDAYGMTNAIKDMSVKNGSLISALSGSFEGGNLPDSYPVPYDITTYKMKAKTVQRDKGRPTSVAKAMTDAKGTITPKALICQFDINDEMIANSTDKQIYDYVVRKATESARNSMENMIINGDTEAGATGNVNSDDQLPATTFTDGNSDDSLLIDHGIRESAINNSMTVDVGAFDSDDLLTMIAKMSSVYQNQVSELMFIFNPQTYIKAQADDALKLAYATRNATIDGGQMKPYGIQTIVNDYVPKTEADGKVCKTAGNNTLGQILLVYKPAIRWGFGKEVLVETERVQGYGFEITVTMKFGFVILDATHNCVAGINVTVA